jgi:polyisoprenoid-binding protein YceI
MIRLRVHATTKELPMAATPEVTPQTTIPAGRWAPDPVHSSISFRVRNMGIVTVTGYFADFEGSLVSDGTLEGTHAEGTVEVPSITTRSEKRDQHLLADDFFAAEQHPQIRFSSTTIEPDGEGFNVTGDLTIKGITRSVQLHAVPQAPEPVDDPWGGTRIGLEVTGEIDRRDYDLNWDVRTPAGVPLASHTVKLDLLLGLVQTEVA